MKKFNECLFRLKRVLRVASDKEVAEILGLSQKAFTARKRRDAFPEDKLLALSATRPDLGIDVSYVLTGRSAKRDAASKEEFDKANMRVMEYAKQYHVERLEELVARGEFDDVEFTVNYDARIEELMKNYSDATEDGKLAIEATARSVRKISD